MTIAITNQKGGVGKTTTAWVLACALNRRARVLSVDLDAQANLSYIFGAGEGGTVYDVLCGGSVEDAIQHTPMGDILPGTILLSGADIEFSRTGREYLLREALTPLQGRYDYILLDTPPALGILTINAFVAADSVILPMSADMLSLQGVAQLNQTLTRVRKYCNAALNLAGILLTRHNSRTVLSRDMTASIATLAEQLGTRVFRSAIRQSVVVQEAQTQGADLLEYGKNAEVTRDYLAWVEELFEGGIL